MHMRPLQPTVSAGQVELISAMDHVNELYIIVGGHVEILADAALMSAPSGRLAGPGGKRLGRTITSATIPEGIAVGAMARSPSSHKGVRGWWGRLRGRPVSIQGSEVELQAALAAEEVRAQGSALGGGAQAAGDSCSRVEKQGLRTSLGTRCMSHAD